LSPARKKIIAFVTPSNRILQLCGKDGKDKQDFNILKMAFSRAGNLFDV